jgi:hypothetical protein
LRSTETAYDLRFRARALITNLADPALHAGGRGFESHRLHSQIRRSAWCEHELGAVKMIVKLRRAGYSYRQVCAELDARGIRPRHADHWEPSTLRKIALRA